RAVGRVRRVLAAVALRLASNARIRVPGRGERIADPDAFLGGGTRVVDHDAVDPRGGRRREERHVLVAEQVGLLDVPRRVLLGERAAVVEIGAERRRRAGGRGGLPEGPDRRTAWIAERDSLVAPGE